MRRLDQQRPVVRLLPCVLEALVRDALILFFAGIGDDALVIRVQSDHHKKMSDGDLLKTEIQEGDDRPLSAHLRLQKFPRTLPDRCLQILSLGILPEVKTQRSLHLRPVDLATNVFGRNVAPPKIQDGSQRGRAALVLGLRVERDLLHIHRVG